MIEKDASTTINSVLLEFQAGNFSIFRKYRRQELDQILQMNPREVPIEFTNLVIKRLVEKKGKNCPLCLLFFCIQSLGYYFLRENEIEDCDIEIKKTRDGWGSSCDGKIILSRSHIATLRSGYIEPLETIFHEL